MLTSVVLTRNEQENIGKCLSSLEFCKEVVIIDDYSSDNTIKIAKEFKIKILKRSIGGDFSDQRNFGLGKVKFGWVLFVDADETVPKALADEILTVVQKDSNIKGYYLKRDDYFLGKKLKYGETSNSTFLRLGQYDSGKWKRRVHEYWDVFGSKSQLKNHLKHFPHPSLKQFFTEVNSMSSLHALANKEEGKRATIIKVGLWPILKFINNWIFKLGVLDGYRGLIQSFVMSSHSFFSWAKLWLMRKEETHQK